MRWQLWFPGVAILALTITVASHSGAPTTAPATRPVYKSPLGLVVDAEGKRAYVALHTAGTVAIVDLKKGTVEREIPVGKGPHDIFFDEVLLNGPGDFRSSKLYVSCEDEDAVAIINAENGKVEKKLKVGQAPQGLYVLSKLPRIFVVCHDEKCLQSIDPRSGKRESLPLPGWPTQIHPDWRISAAWNFITVSSNPGQAVVSVIDGKDKLRVDHNLVLGGVTNVHGGSHGLLVHQKPRTNIPTTQIAQGWVFTNVSSEISPFIIGQDLSNPETSLLLDSPQRGYSDPSDVKFAWNLGNVFIASAGADCILEVSLENLRQLAERNAENRIYMDNKKHEKREDLTLSRQYVTRVIPTGANPRRMALSGDGKTLVVANYLDDSLTVIDVPSLTVTRTILLGGPQPDAARRGEQLFHSSKLTQFGQFSCASCHPGGGSDGLTWDLTRDGIANFMNTRSLLGVKDTPGYGWYSSSPTLADRVRGTLRNLHHYEPTAKEVADLTAYLQTLPPPRPLPSSASAETLARGKALFQGKAGCVQCHRGDTYQDGQAHNIGTRRPQDTSSRFDTPSLRGVARSAPYLHDGRAVTLEEIFTRHNADHLHGQAHQLTPAELQDVLAYLKSL